MISSGRNNLRVFNFTSLAVCITLFATLVLRDFVARKSSQDYIFQLSVPFLLGLISVVVGIYASKNRSRIFLKSILGRTDTALACLVFGLFIVAIFVERPLEGFGTELWNGFGPLVTIVSISITFALMHRRFIPSTRFWRSLCFILLCLLIPTFIQTPGGIININDTTYHVLDEFLAQFNGFFPHSTYSPTYTSMFGWIIYPLRFLDLSAAVVMLVVICIANLMFVAIPTFIAGVVKSIDKEISFVAVLLAASSIMAISGETNGSSTLLSGFSTFGRYFFPFLGLLLLAKACSTKDDSIRHGLFAGLGVVSSITLFNNADFGLTFAIAMYLGLTFVSIIDRSLRRVFLFFNVGMALFSVCYLLFLFCFAEGFSLKMYISLVLLGQSGDIYLFRMPFLGPHLVIFAVTSSLLAIALRSILDHKNRQAPRSVSGLDMLSLISTLWTLALLMMFSVRPIIPFGSQQLLIPTILNIFLILCYTKNEMIDREWNATRWIAIRRLPMMILLVLPFAAVLQMPNPIEEAKRVSGHARHANWTSNSLRSPADGWTPDILRQQGTLHYPQPWLTAIEEYARLNASTIQKTGYFGYMGNTVELITGIENLTGISGPEHMRFGVDFEKWACSPIEREKPHTLIVFGAVIPCKSLTHMGSDGSGLLQIYLVAP